MDILEYFYENPAKNVHFIQRKIRLENDKILLCGSFDTGKSAMIANYLSESKNFLYINLGDLRITTYEFLSDVANFVRQKNIEAVGIDGVCFSLLASIKNLNDVAPKIIISTSQKSLEISGFHRHELFGLDYEEFIAFYKKNYDAKMIFSHFLARGNSLSSVNLADSQIALAIQNLVKSKFDSCEIAILSILCLQIHSELNIYKIYKDLKEKIKISKDRLYAIISSFEDSYVIEFVPNYDEKSRFKRVYFSDFGLKNVLNFERDPKKVIANMVFCELKKLKQEIFFTSEIDFYIPNLREGILIFPFSSPEIIFLRIKKNIDVYKKLSIKKITIISNANEASSSISGICCYVMTFWSWALSL